mgnify:FL=1
MYAGNPKEQAVHLKIQKRKGRQYLSVVQNYRENGTTKTRTVETIGYADAYEGEYDDPIEHFRAYVAELNEREAEGNAKVELRFSRDAQIGDTDAPAMRLGSAVALGCLDALGVKQFFNARCSHEHFPHAAGRIFEMLATERMMHVASKRESWERRGAFPRACAFSFENVYAALVCFARHDAQLTRAMRVACENIRPYDRSCGYLACAPFVFSPTTDVHPAGPQNDGAGTAGSTTHESARETHWMCMLMDAEGIPLDYQLVEGEPDAHALAELASWGRREHGLQRVVVIAGRLSHMEDAMLALSAQGDGFVLYEPIHAGSTLAEWASATQGYVRSEKGTYRIKSRTRTVSVGEDGALGEPSSESDGTQSQNDQVDADGNSGANENATTNDAVSIAGKAGASDHATLGISLTIKEVVLRSQGYACTITSETRLSAARIFNLFRELWRLTEPFQVMEADFSPMPYPVPHADHIRAHFLVCYAAFMALRMLRWRTNWQYNAAGMADALLHMEGMHLQQNWYLFNYRTPVTDLIEEACDIPVARRLRTPADVRSAITSTCKAFG